MEAEFTKYSRYGINYAPDTELAQDKANYLGVASTPCPLCAGKG